MIITQNHGVVIPPNASNDAPLTAPESGLGGVQRGEAPLPCLDSNISTERLSVQHRKAASALGWNVFWFAQKHGLENLGFLTLTFKDHVTSVKEAQRRLNSLLSHVIKPRYGDYIGVMERQKSGRIHYHLLVHVGFDIRSGFDFSAVDRQDYTSAAPALRAEWAFWRKTAPKYRFGRTELMPIKSSEEAIGKYIGKYIGKHMEARQEADKNARLVRYSRGARLASTRFQYVSAGSAQWREKLRAFAHYVSERTGCEPTMEGIRQICGPRWAYHHRELILSMPCAQADSETGDASACARARGSVPPAAAMESSAPRVNESPKQPAALPLPRFDRPPAKAPASGCNVTVQHPGPLTPPYSNTGGNTPPAPPDA